MDDAFFIPDTRRSFTPHQSDHVGVMALKQFPDNPHNAFLEAVYFAKKSSK
ncbi:hypothetical protein [Gilliamella sp. ESL0254]|uniref:hypothetical protein n=1 Tax=Gilliamella sp. ESL0254 TaxID=2705035 RepID=UPI001580E932|nr:hypothetical protein [Gilliamella sp. ESL0254]NUF27218.1 hypothetical protein [Gilliamella sp. ESL0254]